MKTKFYYIVYFKPVFADTFMSAKRCSNLAKAKEYIKLETASVHKYCGRYNLDNNFKIERIEE